MRLSGSNLAVLAPPLPVSHGLLHLPLLAPPPCRCSRAGLALVVISFLVALVVPIAHVDCCSCFCSTSLLARRSAGPCRRGCSVVGPAIASAKDTTVACARCLCRRMRRQWDARTLVRSHDYYVCTRVRRQMQMHARVHMIAYVVILNPFSLLA